MLAMTAILSSPTSRLLLTEDTRFVNGDVENVKVGVKLEASGLFDTTTEELTAALVAFREVRIEIEAPLLPSDVIIGQSISLLGLTLFVTDETRTPMAYLLSA